MLVWNLGHRATIDPFCEASLICLKSKRIIIYDKSKNGTENLRLLPLPPIIFQQISYYYDHLNNLASKLEFAKKDYPELQPFRQYLQHLYVGKELDNKRLFFKALVFRTRITRRHQFWAPLYGYTFNGVFKY